jgi:hypothetical protein
MLIVAVMIQSPPLELPFAFAAAVDRTLGHDRDGTRGHSARAEPP